MLHGEIKVNDKEIAYWQAVRQEPLQDERQVSTYKCVVAKKLIGGEYRYATFTLTHRYDDGASMLTIRVLTESERIFLERYGAA